MSQQWKQQFADPKGITHKDAAGNGILAHGTTVPTDTTSGYAVGCVFRDIDAAEDAQFWINTGSATSCAFKAIKTSQVAAMTTFFAALQSTQAEIDAVADLSARYQSVTASATLSAASHSGKLLALNAIAGLTITLPAPTGSGAVYDIACETGVTSNGYIISSSGANIFGALLVSNDTGVGNLFTTLVATGSTGKTNITLDGTTKGGRKGDRVVIVDRFASGYQVEGRLQGSGTEDTPFS